MRQLNGNRSATGTKRRFRLSTSLREGSIPASVLDRTSLVTTGPTQIVWVKATPASAKNLAARIRSDLSLPYEDCLRIATRCVSEKYTSFEDLVERTREHPYLCFTMVGSWTKRVHELVGEPGKSLKDGVLSEWFWTLFRKVVDVE